MSSAPVTRLPPVLETAVQRVERAARTAAERTIESLGLAALASRDVFHRDGLLGAQFELNRKSAVFALAFNDSLEQRIGREFGPRGSGGDTPWDALTLVEDREVELQVAAERFALEVAHSCEWELRELDAYVVPLLGTLRGENERNPLRPEVVGHAMLHAVDRVSDRTEVRQVLAVEMARSFGAILRTCYAEIVADLRQAGLKPVGLQVRAADARRADGPPSTRDAVLDAVSAEVERRRVGAATTGGGRLGPAVSGPGGWAGSRGGGLAPGGTRGGSLGSVDPAVMALLRRLSFAEGGFGGGLGLDTGDDGGTAGFAGDDGGGRVLPNLIRAHREELRQLATGSLDHMVIDVVGSLFDQILSDPKVPPQIARQIGRLQGPVLRAALGDPSFFSSRRHPVRRFVNRIASLGAAFDDFSDEAARAVLAKVRALVQEVVEGDFDQIALYESRLSELESFIDEQGRREADAQGGAAGLLAAKEHELQLGLAYARQLEDELRALEGPDFLRDFVARVWSQVILKAAAQHGADGERTRRLRAVGRELFMSVQAKTSPQQRKTFLAELPRLMKELGEGLDLIAWPDAERRAFFGQLLPAHAEALKAEPMRPLDFNLLAKRVEGALDRPLPRREDLPRTPLPVLHDAIGRAEVAPRFTPEEAAQVGLVDEAQVDLAKPVASEPPDEPPPPAASELPADGLPLPTAGEPAEPVAGAALAAHLQAGCAYRMHLDDGWHKVRLAHVSAGRTFYVFHHGGRHRRTVSLTHRMLVKLCESGRLRAFESTDLIARATARARQQLAALRPGG